MNNIKPRNPIMAAGMSLILPGFGQLYNGAVNRGLLIFMAFTLVTIPLILWVTMGLASSLTLALLILTIIINVGIWIYAIVDAWKTAKLSKHYILANWQIPAIYLIIFLSAVFYFVPSMSQYMRTHLVESFRVPSSSMSPSIMQGDVLFANKNYNCAGCSQAAQRGDIAIFVYPNDRTQYYIKRIIALPGDRISVQGTQVFVNGRTLSTNTSQQESDIQETLDNVSYTVRWGSYQPDFNEFVVPNGEVFMMGDNRSNSKDSRHFGTVALRDVVGKASQVWLSHGQDGFRWERFGLAFE